MKWRALVLPAFCIYFANASAFALSPVTAPTLINESFCERFPRICAAHEEQRDLINSFNSSLDRQKIEMIVSPDFDFYSGMSETQIEAVIETALKITKSSEFKEEALEDITSWMCDALNYDGVVLRNGNERVAQFMDSFARLDSYQGLTLQKYILDNRSISSKSKIAFKILIRETILASNDFREMLDFVKKFTDLRSGMDFLDSFTKDELIHLGSLSKYKAEEAWSFSYVDFLSDLNDPEKNWTFDEMYNGQFFPREVSTINFGYVYSGQENDIGSSARVVFDPKIGRKIEVNGVIKNVNLIEITIMDSKGVSHALSLNDGRFLTFFVSEKTNFISASAYSEYLFEFFKKDPFFNPCSLFTN